VQRPESIHEEQAKALRGEPSGMLEVAEREAIAAIEEDGAEVIMLGCSASFWLQPFLQKRLADAGWEVPVLEVFRCAIQFAKLFVDLGTGSSGPMVPCERPKRWRRKKTF
jgi:Asp/Glu/hydantoin racemase